MSVEEAIQTELTARFPELRETVRVQRVRRLTAHAPCEKIGEVLDFAINQGRFCILCTITGLDQGDTLGVIYHLARESGVTLSLATSLPKAKPVLQSISDRFPAAEMYERELVDLLGVQVVGLPEGPRYPLPDGWPANQYPLRKDWKSESLEQGAPSPGEVKDV